MVGPTAQYWQNMLKPKTQVPYYPLCSTHYTDNPTYTPDLLIATYDAFGSGCGSLYNETTVPWIMDLSDFPHACNGGEQLLQQPVLVAMGLALDRLLELQRPAGRSAPADVSWSPVRP